MKTLFITFYSTMQITDFVNLVSKCEFDVDVKYGSRIVDGKSLLGVLSLASGKTVQVILHSDNCDLSLEQFVSAAS